MEFFTLLSLALFSLSGYAGVASAANATASLSNATYKNPNASIKARVADLVSRMTLQDKVAQLMQGDITNWLNGTSGEFNYSGLVANMEYKAGSFYVGTINRQDYLIENIKRAQDYLLYNTTLGIPALVQTEGIHGFLFPNATIFNSPIAYGCSFNPDLVEEMAKAIGEEAAALGVNQLFAPLGDLAREQRYGRVEETNSEDAYLAGEIAYSYVVGLQSTKVSSTVKHFAAYSNPEQGLNCGPVHGGERERRMTWLPSYKRAIVDADAWSIMSAYHSYDGVPAISDYHLLTEILRDEWGYEYYVISDAGATDRLFDNFMICGTDDYECVTENVLPAGNDVEMGGGSFNFKTIPELIDSGKIDLDDVNTAVSRVLMAKFKMGLFENPYSALNYSLINGTVHTPEKIALARKLDKESIVLLENHNSTLPLSKNSKIAVIGPMADGVMNYGDYVFAHSDERGVTPLVGIKTAVGSNGSVIYTQGCEKWSNSQSGFSEAVAAAESADVAVVVVGTWSRDQSELWSGLNATTGEHVDVADLHLVGAQSALVKAIADTGVPTVVVYSSGKPITEPWISNGTAALVQQFYPSEQGGNALADVLFGDYNPSGKLSMSFPYDVGTLPIYYDYYHSGRTTDPGSVDSNGTLVFGHQYVLNTPQPLYEFGYGKSYTTFEYSNITLSKKNATTTDTVQVSVSVTNSGSVDGTEVVQVYIEDKISSVEVPNQLLKGFKKVFIPAGSTKTVTIPIKVEDLGLWNIRMKYVVEPGEFEVYVGSSSLDIRSTSSFYVS
ncbi:MAG: hypothetical protein M1834_008528 [Cirrosporium novae-zelandiae]|nr:MAG: hypothetical protein M1834_008528 [Cirrosporium novae-zelandiae]